MQTTVDFFETEEGQDELMKKEATHTTKLREASGHIESSDALVEFLYLLMRDYLPTGVVETIVAEIESDKMPTLYTNGYLAKYAKYLSKRIRQIK